MTDFDSVVMELAQEYQIDDKGFGVGGVLDFAHAIRAHVVEECAAKCEEMRDTCKKLEGPYSNSFSMAYDHAAAALRAMTQAGELKP